MNRTVAQYRVTHDPASGIVICRIFGPLSDAAARSLATEMMEVTAAVRRHSPAVRLLFDNRKGPPFTAGVPELVVSQLRSAARPGDRTAILVRSSLTKIQAKPSLNEGNHTFLSESAALTWLNAWENGRPAKEGQDAQA